MNSVVLLTALAVAAPGLKEKPPPPTAPTGEWELQSRTINARTTKPAPGQTYTFTPDGRWLQHQDGREMLSAVERRIDFDLKAQPPTIDLYGKGTSATSRFLGIYKIEGDTLTICGRRGERATTFESPTGSEQELLVFKRVK